MRGSKRVKDWMIKLGLVIGTVAICLIIFEIALGFFTPSVLSLKGLGQYDPIVGYKLTPNFEGHAHSSEYDVFVRINSQGIRDNEEYSITKKNGTTRILGLGDSFTFGCWANINDTYLGALEKKFRDNLYDVEIIKAGVVGYGTDNEFYFLKQYWFEYKPNIVLVGFFVGNDVRDTMCGVHKYDIVDGVFEWNESIYKKWSGGNTTNTRRVSVLQSFKSFFVSLFPNTSTLIAKSNLCDFVTTKLFKNNNPLKPAKLTLFHHESFFQKNYPEDIERGWQETLGYLKEMNDILEKNNSKLVIVLIPTKTQIHDEFWEESKRVYGLNDEDYNRSKPNNILLDFGEENNITVLDLLPEFREHAKNGEQLYFKNDDHWNANGHKLAAERIYDKLIEEQLRPLGGEQ